EKQAIFLHYRDKRLRDDPIVQTAAAKRASYRPVVEVALDLGIIHLSRARGMKDAERKEELAKAEEILKAGRGVAGLASDLQLGQVYFWMGRLAEAKKLFDGLLSERKRVPETLLRVSLALREVGDLASARKLAEEAYQTETDQNKKAVAAVVRSGCRLDWE